MEKVFGDFPLQGIWNGIWTTRTIEQELEACEIHSPLRELFLSYLPPKGKILEAGCGFGKWVIFLKRQGYDIVGIDDNELAIAKLKSFDESLQVELGDILDIPYPDSSFDAYISMGVVEHFEDGPIQALKEAYRVLKPGGLIFVSVPTVNVIRKLFRQPLRKSIKEFPRTRTILQSSGWSKNRRGALRVLIGRLLPRIGREYCYFWEYRYTKSELDKFLQQTGFEIIKTVPDDYYGSKDHAVGLVVDFPFLGARNGVNFQLNPIGKLISRTLDKLSPWIACSMVLYIGRLKK